MTTVTSAPAPASRRRWLRRLALAAVALLVLLVVAGFVVTSEAFFKSVILPRAGAALNARVSVGSARIEPFSGLVLRDLRVETVGDRPLLTVGEVRVRYRFGSLLAGAPVVEELTLLRPHIQVIQNVDGTSNLDPLLSAPAGSPPPPPAAPAAAPPRFLLQNLRLEEGQLSWTRPSAAGRVEAATTGLTVALDRIGPGASGRLQVDSLLAWDRVVSNRTDRLRSRLHSVVEFRLRPDLLPETVKLEASHTVLETAGQWGPLAGLAAEGTGELTAEALKALRLSVHQSNAPLAEVRASGPLDLAKREARIRLELPQVHPRLLQLAGASTGIGLDAQRLQASADVELTRGGDLLNVGVRLDVAGLRVAPAGPWTPPLDLQFGSALAVQPATLQVRLNTLTLNASQAGQPLLKGELPRPMTFDLEHWAAGPAGTTLEIELAGLDLAGWLPALTGLPAAGSIDASLQLQPAREDGQLGALLTAQAQRIVWPWATNQAVTFDGTGQFEAALAPSGETKAKGLLGVTNLALRVSGKPAGTPLALKVGMEATWHTNGMLDLRELTLRLPASSHAATNLARLSGRVALPATNGLSAQLALGCDTLDVTALYDFVEALGNTPSPPPPTPATTAPVEPEPMTFALQDARLDANLARVFLRHVALSNVQTRMTATASSVQVDRLALALNGAPVQARGVLDVGQRGWAYQLGLQADAVPMQPLVDSFVPAWQGQCKGQLLADLDVRGAGLTLPSVRSNLAASARLTFTNAQIQLFSPKTSQLLTPIATFLRIGDINQSPIHWLHTALQLEKGRLDLQAFSVQTEAFEARMRGRIDLQQLPGQSPVDLPVDFRLRRSLAQRANLLPPDAPPDAAYVALPPFLTLRGTLEQPKSELDELKMSGVLLKSGVGVARQLGVDVDDRTDRVLQGIGSLLTGPAPGPQTTPTNTPRAPSTNPAPSLRDLLRPKR